MIVGYIYYHPKVAGTAWMNTNGFTMESLSKGNMPVIMGVSYVMSVILSFFVTFFVIHQGGAFSMMMPEIMTDQAVVDQFNGLMAQYGGNGRSFGHGALHGGMGALFFVFPLITINSLFEQRGWKYILIHSVYWLICLALIGGVLCSTLEYGPVTI